MNPEQWLSLKWNGGSTMSDRWLNQSKIIQEGDGFLLCYKRLEQKASKFQWPRSQEEVCKLTSQQFRWLMEVLTIKPKKCIQKIDHPRFI